MKPRLLDLFCGAGGAGVGYHRAGFDVVGVDVVPQPRYPFEFYEADAVAVMETLVAVGSWLAFDDRVLRLSSFDVIHASPPCQRWLGVPFALGKKAYPDLLAPTRQLLRAIGLPYVIENVPTAPLEGFVLCGSTFGLPVVRHRRFESNVLMLAPSACPQRSWKRGTAHTGTYPYAHGAWRSAWRQHVLPIVWPWMTLEEAGEAIPPDYTEWIGAQLLSALEAAA